MLSLNCTVVICYVCTVLFVNTVQFVICYICTVLFVNTVQFVMCYICTELFVNAVQLSYVITETYSCHMLYLHCTVC